MAEKQIVRKTQFSATVVLTVGGSHGKVPIAVVIGSPQADAIGKRYVYLASGICVSVSSTVYSKGKSILHCVRPRPPSSLSILLHNSHRGI